MEFDVKRLTWIHKPTSFSISKDEIVMTTDPETDYWQRTYYGFSNDNAPTLVMPIDTDFSFTVKTESNSQKMFDQCGVIIYQNSDNWFKASIEYENDQCQRLGSVVTNLGYSDWATTDIPANLKKMVYRLSRRGSDFLIENSLDGVTFHQMRIFHLFEGQGQIQVGVYACSPLKSSFNARFTEFYLGDCIWEQHTNPDSIAIGKEIKG